jgi:hypothetical protein
METPPPPTEANVAARHIAALDFELAKADYLERLKFQADFAKVAWQALALVNGGAIVALFTFIADAHPTVNQYWLWSGFGCFAFGLAINIASIVCGFMSQAYYMRATASSAWNEQAKMHGYPPQFEDPHKEAMKVGDRWHAVALAACVLSLVVFVAGAACSMHAVGYSGDSTVARASLNPHR